jgi:uncharacterized repeat protein (TIGR01451 family)
LEWEGYAGDTFDGLGPHTTNCVAATGLSLSKTVTPTTNIAYQNEITYTIVLSNGIGTDATGTVLTDTLPTTLSFTRWVEQPAVADDNSGTEITWSGTVTAGQAITFYLWGHQQRSQRPGDQHRRVQP